MLLEMQMQMGVNTPFQIEISKKVVGEHEYVDRLNLLYSEKLEECYCNYLEFLKNQQAGYGMKLKTIQGLDLVRDADLSNLIQIYFGLDLRPDACQSRFKVWFEFTNVATLIERTFKQLGYFEKVKEYIVRDNLLLGFGLYPDGRCEIKPYLNYGEFRHDLRAKLKLSSLFEKRVFEAFDFGNPLYLCFHGVEPRISISFCQVDVNELLQSLEIDQIHREILLLNGQEPDILSAYYDELLEQSLREYNLYYLLKAPSETGQESVAL